VIRILSMRWLTAGLIGILLGMYLSELNILNKVRFAIFPVVTMGGYPIQVADGSFYINIRGTKNRGDECVFKNIQAIGERLVGLPVDLNIDRVDRAIIGTTKVAGSYDIGEWRIWPTQDIVAFHVYINHICSKTPWTTEVAMCKLDLTAAKEEDKLTCSR